MLLGYYKYKKIQKVTQQSLCRRNVHSQQTQPVLMKEWSCSLVL